MASQLDEEIITVERKLWRLPMWAIQQRLIALEQSLAANWMLTGGGGSGPPPANATVSGSIGTCQSANYQTGTVQIYNGSTLLWSGSTNSSGSYNAGSTMFPSGVTLDFIFTPTNTKYVATTVTPTLSPGANLVGCVPTPAANYYCGVCVDPIHYTISLTLNSGPCAAGETWPNDTLYYGPLPQPIGGRSLGWLGTATVVHAGQNWNYALTMPRTLFGSCNYGLVNSGGTAMTGTQNTRSCAPFLCNGIWQGCSSGMGFAFNEV
jgi:hypothetical protein